jgi:hypothetical protein
MRGRVCGSYRDHTARKEIDVECRAWVGSGSAAARYINPHDFSAAVRLDASAIGKQAATEQCGSQPGGYQGRVSGGGAADHAEVATRDPPRQSQWIAFPISSLPPSGVPPLPPPVTPRGNAQPALTEAVAGLLPLLPLYSSKKRIGAAGKGHARTASCTHLEAGVTGVTG